MQLKNSMKNLVVTRLIVGVASVCASVALADFATYYAPSAYNTPFFAPTISGGWDLTINPGSAGDDSYGLWLLNKQQLNINGNSAGTFPGLFTISHDVDAAEILLGKNQLRFTYTGGTSPIDPQDKFGVVYDPVGPAPMQYIQLVPPNLGGGEYTWTGLNIGDVIGWWINSDGGTGHPAPAFTITDFQHVPEPSTVAMCGLVVAAVSGVVIRRRMKA